MKSISVIPILLVSWAIMILIIMRINKKKPGIISYHEIQLSSLKPLSYMHAVSAIVMFFPVIIINQLPGFLLSFPDKINVNQAMAFLASFGIIGFFPWKKFSNKGKERENISSSSILHISLYALLRIIFLVVYEWFFRGLLLISFAAWLGINRSIIINIFLYVLMHFHKNKKEMIGCIPLGLLFCAFTIWWQSIWPAIIFHLQIAIINEWPPLQQFILPQKQTAQ